jgi:hydrogenase 3 maturation protease
LAENRSQKHEVQKDLRNWFLNARRIVLAGIGNPIRKDDFVGVRIIQNLKVKTAKSVFLIECETVPESFTQQIIDFNPTHILLIDAAILGLKPGESRLIEPEKLTSSSSYSSHMLPLRIFCEYVSQVSKAKIRLLLIEPKDTEFGEGLTPELDAAAKSISRSLLQILRDHKQS